MKAVVLAAGSGVRFRPLTDTRPKAMLPVAGKPLVQHTIEAVAAAGVRELVLVVGYRRPQIQQYFGDGDRFDVDIEYVVQDPLLGTADALLQAESRLDEQFLVLSGSQVVSTELVESLIAHAQDRPEHVLTARPSKRSDVHRVVTVSDGRVRAINGRQLSDRTPSLVDIELYALTDDIFDEIRRIRPHDGTEIELTDVLASLVDEIPILAHRGDGPWYEVIYPWDLLTVTEQLNRSADEARPAIDENVSIEQNATVKGATTLGANVTVRPGAVVEDTIVLRGVTIDSGAVVRDAVVGSGSTIGPNATIVGGRGEVAIGDRIHSDVRLGAMVGDNATIEGGATVRTGTIIGSNARVRAGATCQGRIESDTVID